MHVFESTLANLLSGLRGAPRCARAPPPPIEQRGAAVATAAAGGHGRGGDRGPLHSTLHAHAARALL
eukprot:7630555-Alexandrium_andersonii.AAC.1